MVVVGEKIAFVRNCKEQTIRNTISTSNPWISEEQVIWNHDLSAFTTHTHGSHFEYLILTPKRQKYPPAISRNWNQRTEILLKHLPTVSQKSLLFQKKAPNIRNGTIYFITEVKWKEATISWHFTVARHCVFCHKEHTWCTCEGVHEGLQNHGPALWRLPACVSLLLLDVSPGTLWNSVRIWGIQRLSTVHHELFEQGNSLAGCSWV